MIFLMPTGAGRLFIFTMGLTYNAGNHKRLKVCICSLLRQGIAVVTNMVDAIAEDKEQASLLYLGRSFAYA